MRGVVPGVQIAALVLLQGCTFMQLRTEPSELYSSPAVAALDVPDFMKSHGRKGLWQPLSFVKEKRRGVYLLEPYAPDRIPVLFIHGAGGTPQDWRYFVANLDQTKYQAWVYHFP